MEHHSQKPVATSDTPGYPAGQMSRKRDERNQSQAERKRRTQKQRLDWLAKRLDDAGVDLSDDLLAKAPTMLRKQRRALVARLTGGKEA